jgi:hypothetical protein
MNSKQPGTRHLSFLLVASSAVPSPVFGQARQRNARNRGNRRQDSVAYIFAGHPVIFCILAELVGLVRKLTGFVADHNPRFQALETPGLEVAQDVNRTGFARLRIFPILFLAPTGGIDCSIGSFGNQLDIFFVKLFQNIRIHALDNGGCQGADQLEWQFYQAGKEPTDCTLAGFLAGVPG